MYVWTPYGPIMVPPAPPMAAMGPFMVPPTPLGAAMGPFMVPPAPLGAGMRPFMVPLAPRSLLNPYAEPFTPEPYADRRCVFLTFSNGYPLLESQIFAFFNRMYSPYVEDVFVHKPRSKGKEVKPSLFGKVMFKLTLVPDLVLGDHEKVCFDVEGVPLYCRRFKDQKTRNAEAASSSNHGGGN